MHNYKYLEILIEFILKYYILGRKTDACMQFATIL